MASGQIGGARQGIVNRQSSIPGGPLVFCLNIHADYVCRRAGACCTAGWHIPAEPRVERTVREVAIDHSVRARTGLTGALFEHEGSLTVIRHADGHECVFFERGQEGRPHVCAIHRVAGHEALPVACRQFPRVSVTDGCGTRATLSHFCPTAARTLFRDDLATLAVVEAPTTLLGNSRAEGLDARDALPPLLRPGMLMDLESYAEWERHAVAVFGDDRHSPESALRRLGGEIEALRAWTPATGPLRVPAAAGVAAGPRAREADLAVAERDAARGDTPVPRASSLSLREAYELVTRCVPAGLDVTAFPSRFEPVDDRCVVPAWPSFSRPLRRYLGARAFASWIPWHAGGLRTWLAALEVAVALVRVEAVRQCGLEGRPLESERLLEAIRQADLLLVHKVDTRTFAERLSRLVE